MSNLSNTYEINTGNFFYQPKNYSNLHNKNYYYPNNIYTNSNIYNYSLNEKDKNYFNTRTRSSNYNLYYKGLNDINNFKIDLSHKNTKYNLKSDKKIKLAYEFENISPNEINDKTKEIINLQSQMCSLDNDDEDNIKTKTNNNIIKNKKIKKKNKKISRIQKTIKNNFLTGLITNKTKNRKSFKRNYTFTELLNNNNKFKISTFEENKSQIKRKNNSKKNIIRILKDECKELDKEIFDVKNRVKKLKDKNSLLSERINKIKGKEENKYSIYDKDFQIKKYNKKLLEKLKLSEEIKKKQIELIIKMQKEVNNMRLKLHMLGENCY